MDECLCWSEARYCDFYLYSLIVLLYMTFGRDQKDSSAALKKVLQVGYEMELWWYIAAVHPKFWCFAASIFSVWDFYLNKLKSETASLAK